MPLKQPDWRNTPIIDATEASARYGTSGFASSSLPSVPAVASPSLDAAPPVNWRDTPIVEAPPPPTPIAPANDEWSPEAREAAAKARKEMARPEVKAATRLSMRQNKGMHENPEERPARAYNRKYEKEHPEAKKAKEIAGDFNPHHDPHSGEFSSGGSGGGKQEKPKGASGGKYRVRAEGEAQSLMTEIMKKGAENATFAEKREVVMAQMTTAQMRRLREKGKNLSKSDVNNQFEARVLRERLSNAKNEKERRAIEKEYESSLEE